MHEHFEKINRYLSNLSYKNISSLQFQPCVKHKNNIIGKNIAVVQLLLKQRDKDYELTISNKDLEIELCKLSKQDKVFSGRGELINALKSLADRKVVSLVKFNEGINYYNRIKLNPKIQFTHMHIDTGIKY